MKPAPGLWGIGLAAAFLCACAVGADELESSDGAVVGRPNEDEDTGADESEPDAEVPFDSGYSYTEAGADDGQTEASGGDTGASSDAGSSNDAGSRNDAGASTDAGASSDAGSSSDAGARNDAGASTDAGATQDAGPRDAGSDAARDSGGTPGGTTDAGGGTPGGTTDAGGGTPGGGTCSADKCTNDCSIAAPFHCCTRDNQCGCSWFSVAYCND